MQTVRWYGKAHFGEKQAKTRGNSMFSRVLNYHFLSKPHLIHQLTLTPSHQGEDLISCGRPTFSTV